MPDRRGGGTLVVLRGNSGSGKSAVAARVQAQMPRGGCALISQDRVRRDVLREPDVTGGLNVDLIEHMAGFCLGTCAVTIVEGIMNARRYGAMLERLSRCAGRSLFYAYDLSFEETARRHRLRPERDDFASDTMRHWYHGWQPLDFVEERRFDESWSLDDAVGRILGDLTA